MNTKISQDVIDEVLEAEYNFPLPISAHEGYAIILEELDELWDEVKKKKENRNNACMYNEAKQVACTAIRFMTMLKQ